MKNGNKIKVSFLFTFNQKNYFVDKKYALVKIKLIMKKIYTKTNDNVYREWIP